MWLKKSVLIGRLNNLIALAERHQDFCVELSSSTQSKAVRNHSAKLQVPVFVWLQLYTLADFGLGIRFVVYSR